MAIGRVFPSKDPYYTRLSTDTKPTNPAHALLYTIDTQTWEIWDGNSWEPYVSATAQGGWRAASKTVTFTGAAGAGAVGSVALFTVTGAVEVWAPAIHCTTDLVDAGGGTPATLTLGVTGQTGLFFNTPINPADGLDAGEWAGTGPIGVGGALNDPDFLTFSLSANIIATIANEAINSGVIVVYLHWRPRSAGATLVAA